MSSRRLDGSKSAVAPRWPAAPNRRDAIMTRPSSLDTPRAAKLKLARVMHEPNRFDGVGCSSKVRDRSMLCVAIFERVHGEGIAPVEGFVFEAVAPPTRGLVFRVPATGPPAGTFDARNALDPCHF